MSEHIGILRERSLHASVKQWYALPGDLLEERVGGYVVDIVRDGSIARDRQLLIEIQTRGFAPLKRKLRRLTEEYEVRLVHPIPREKWILRLAADEETVIGRRKSPKRGMAAHLFEQLVSIPELVSRDSFSIEVLMIQEEEVRCYDGRGSWRHREWTRRDRRLLEVVERRIFAQPADFLDFVPAQLKRPFTNREFAESTSYSLGLAGNSPTASRRWAPSRWSVSEAGRSCSPRPPERPVPGEGPAFPPEVAYLRRAGCQSRRQGHLPPVCGAELQNP